MTALLTMQTDWGVGYCANVDISNNGTVAVTSWTAVVNFSNATLSTLWNGTPTVADGLMTVVPLEFTAHIAPGDTQNFGFCAATTAANYTPSIASLSYTD